MRPTVDYYGPVWVVAGEHKGKLAFVDDHYTDGGRELAVAYLEGETPSVGAYVLFQLDELDAPPESELDALEERIWVSAVMSRASDSPDRITGEDLQPMRRNAGRPPPKGWWVR